MSDGHTTGRAASAIKTIKVRARDEDFRIIQLQGNLFVCAKANGSCCCGWEEKGRAPIDHALYEAEWERRKIRNKLHLTFTGCLGPCATGNNALLQLFGQSIWLKDLNDDSLIPAIFDYIEAMLHAERVLMPPPGLAEHVFLRYLPTPDDNQELVLATAQEVDGGLERLDPVCLMDVDPATARWSSEYNGRSYYFCAPACKKSFDREPAAYATA